MAITGRGRARLGGRRAVGLLVTGTAVVLALAAGGSVSQAGAATQDAATQDAATQNAATQAKKPKPTHSQIQLLAINDFHGNLEPASGSSGNINGIPAGGAAYLATQLRTCRGRREGAGPGLGHGCGRGPDRRLAAAVGRVPRRADHRGDERDGPGGCVGRATTSSTRAGTSCSGCRPAAACRTATGQNNQNSCPDAAHTFKGAKFKYLSANVFYENTRKTLFAPYTIKNFKDGKKVGFIGMTLENTPNIVTKSGVEGLAFKDEVETANALVPKLKKQGVESIVVLLHEGGSAGRPEGVQQLPGDLRPDHGHHREPGPGDRRDHLRPHPPGATTARCRTRRASRGSSPARRRSAGRHRGPVEHRQRHRRRRPAEHDGEQPHHHPGRPKDPRT